MCPQRSAFGYNLSSSQSENCLFANVYAPAAYEDGEIRENLPVLAFIHGGGYLVGSASEPLYNASQLSQHWNVIVVTFNYRLNVFGFLGHPALTAAGLSNLALQDQRAALQWVYTNIKAFGGNPDDITLWGQSTGGSSALLQAAVSGSGENGYFKRVISESGPVRGELRTISEAETIGIQFAQAVGCGSDASAATLQCLQTASMEKVSRLMLNQVCDHSASDA